MGGTRDISTVIDGLCLWNRLTMGCITGIGSHEKKLRVEDGVLSRTLVTPERTPAEAEGLAAISAAPAAPAAPSARNRRLLSGELSVSLAVFSDFFSDMLL